MGALKGQRKTLTSRAFVPLFIVDIPAASFATIWMENLQLTIRVGKLIFPGREQFNRILIVVVWVLYVPLNISRKQLIKVSGADRNFQPQPDVS